MNSGSAGKNKPGKRTHRAVTTELPVALSNPGIIHSQRSIHRSIGHTLATVNANNSEPTVSGSSLRNGADCATTSPWLSVLPAHFDAGTSGSRLGLPDMVGASTVVGCRVQVMEPAAQKIEQGAHGRRLGSLLAASLSASCRPEQALSQSGPSAMSY
ncbi:hypothetical protein L209DRAFT_382979 [Thermothelomyces heterothallicus CBS 203.75]